MASREHLDTFESEDHDMVFSIYKTGDEHEIWFSVGGAGFRVLAEQLSELKEMVAAAEEYLEELNGRERLAES